MSAPYQAGVRPTRIEWTTETSEGDPGSDIEWNLFSDNIISAWDWEPDANTQRQNAVGEVTAQGFFNGSETHEATFSYHLQEWYTSSGDAGYDFLEPAGDNSVRNTHTVVGSSEQTSGGANDEGRYIVTVGKGGHPDSLTAPFETEDGSPIEQELTYQFQKIRQYNIEQPPSGGDTLTINNNGSSDVDVTLESFDASTAETNTVSAGGSATTTATFSDLFTVELSTDVDGDVTVEDQSSNTLVTIKGSQAYPAGEGDQGIPATGSGSHASAIGSNYIRFLDDTLSIPNVESDIEIISGEMSVETGLDDNSQIGSAQRNIHATEWTYTVTATLAGSTVSVDQTVNYLTENTGTLTWDESSAAANSIDFNNVFIQSPGSYTKEAGNGKMQMDNEFEAEDITISS
jgi:hypothetical protein